MLHVTLLGGLGDIIDQNDPCTLNPSDPICQATAADTAADPCKVNPNASYCQAAVVQQSSSLPTPGSDSSWTSFLDVLPSLVPKAPAPAITSSVPATASAPAVASTLATLKAPPKAMLIGLGILGVLGLIAYRRHRAAAAA